MMSKGSILRLLLRIAVLIFAIKAIGSSDDYVKELHRKCFKTKRPYFCVTFRIAKYVEDFDFEGPDNSVVKLVKVEPKYGNSDLLATPRYASADSEWNKFIKFLQRKLVHFMTTHGIAFEMPDGFEVVQGRSIDNINDELQKKSHGKYLDRSYEEARGSKIKQKKIFILSIIIMAKLIKILILVNMVFFVLLFIKKIILITAVVFPSVLSHIKQACQQHHHHHQQATVIAEEAPSHASSWFGWRQDNADRSPW